MIPKTIKSLELLDMVNNRRVLGSMNEFVFQSTAIIADDPNVTLDEVSRILSEISCSPLGYGYPREAVTKLLV